MMSSLKHAVELIQVGKKEEARGILLRLLKEDQDNLNAWLCLTRCAVNREQFDISVRNVLRIDPDNDYARRIATTYNIKLYRETVDEYDADDTLEGSVNITQPYHPVTDVDEAMADIADILEPVQPAKRRRTRRKELNVKMPESYMSKRRRRYLRAIQLIGTIAVIAITGVFLLSYLSGREADLSETEQQTRTVLQAEAATAFRQNTLSVATVAARATVFAGTETAIAIETTILSEAEIVYIQSNLIEVRDVFSPDEQIGVTFVAGVRFDRDTPVFIQVVAVDSDMVVQEQETTLGTGQRNVRLSVPEGGWVSGEYHIILMVNDQILDRLAARVLADD